MKHRRLLSTFLFLSLILLLFSPSVIAADDQVSPVDWEQYSIEDLIKIRDELSNVLSEKQRQYAIENGNRKITLNEQELTVFTKQTATLVPDVERVVDDAPETTAFVWSSSDESIAKVASNGTVTGVSLGDAEIKCTAKDDEFIFATAQVHVVLPVTSVALEQTNVSLLLSDDKPEAGSVLLSYSVAPEDAYCSDVTWSSSNEAIALVDENGTVTAVSPGKAVITATSADGSSATPKKATCNVTVLQAVSGLELDATELTLNKKASQTLKVTYSPDNASQKGVSWESSNPDVVRVNANGQLTAQTCGTATITCTTTDGSEISANCEVTVIQMVTGLKLSAGGSSFTLDRGKTRTFPVAVTPEDATNKTLTWTSSDKSILTVDDNGRVNAVGGGTATITCSTTDGSKKTLSFSIFVPSIAVKSTSYTITSKDGRTIEVEYYGKTANLEINYSKNLFSMQRTQSGTTVSMKVHPTTAGTGYIELRDKENSKNNQKITVKIEHSAVYDKVSYPNASYEDILRNPSIWKGDTVSIYGKVLQKMESWGTTTLRVGTGGYGYYDKVFYVTYSGSGVASANVIEDDYVTIYGTCTGTETYTTVLGGKVTIPSLTAEKIVIGRG